ncbi:hypothetical protein EOL94_01185 [bacterium]|nr:hypothetical protein [bacterium]
MKKIFNLRSILISIIIISFFAIIYILKTKGFSFERGNIFTSPGFYLSIIVLTGLILIADLVTKNNRKAWEEIKKYQRDIIERVHEDQEKIEDFNPDKEKFEEGLKNET